ncbi:MAG: LysM peptidoglycan-binding domain-containing protein [bacterium]
MEPLNQMPCPWLLDPSGTITRSPSRAPSRCGAEPARPDLPKVVRAERCLVGGACQIRQAREAQLGPLAASLAPRQPVGDASVIGNAAPPRTSGGSLWRRVVLVVVLASVITVASGPAASVIGPVVTAIMGALTAPGTATPTPSADVSPAASQGDSPGPTPSSSDSPSPSPSPSGSDSATKTYVVQSGDTLYDIGLSLGLGPDGYKEIAALNNISGPAYTISPGQVLKLP